MRKLLCCFLLLFSLRAQAQAPEDKSLLWAISGNNLSQTSFLFGTIHLVCPDDFDLNASIQEKLKLTEQLVLEVDMDDPAMMATMMQAVFMKDTTLQTLLQPQDYTFLQNFFKDSVGLDLAVFGNAKPILLLGPMLGAILSCDPLSYEQELMNLLEDQHQEVVGLETVEEQMTALNAISYADQAEMLMHLVRDLPKAREEFAAMVSRYRAQDINGLFQLTETSEFEVQNYDKALLEDRNRAWIGRMEVLMKDKPSFFAVGAAHLGGAKGVITLLRNAGYQVEPVQ
ncbi:TraB/GumN family protein [Dyadobacter tibetensis]|uniref:TraB/GumN family protein n=1 Tax=Dyadobacter tibetensis TaxID=1211851 RepID=UPI00046FF5A3|nr:TraB/GumN family protein [Dyadobacter tibetensis]